MEKKRFSFKAKMLFYSGFMSLITAVVGVLSYQHGQGAHGEAGLSLIVGTILGGMVIGQVVGYFFAGSFVKRISGATGTLGEGVGQVSNAAEKIAGSAIGLSNSATQQAAFLEETVATMEELTAMVRQNTDNAKQAASLASSTRDIAMKGEKEIKTLIDSINSISADSKRIEEITTVIDDIAFQTNLLALNAAVEAARAGDQGKGFAVVAEAVRSLAQRSSLAAKDIAELIKNSVDKIELGSKQATQGGAVLADIVNSVKKVADLNNEISSASDEQSTGILQISQAMTQLDQITQSNASSSEETASAAEKLSAQSKTLIDGVSSIESVLSGQRKGYSDSSSDYVEPKQAPKNNKEYKPAAGASRAVVRDYKPVAKVVAKPVSRDSKPAVRDFKQPIAPLQKAAIKPVAGKPVAPKPVAAKPAHGKAKPLPAVAGSNVLEFKKVARIPKKTKPKAASIIPFDTDAPVVDETPGQSVEHAPVGKVGTTDGF